VASRVVGVNDVLDGHVGLDLECLDRIYLNGWVPNLQVSGQVVNFLTHHLGFPIPSPAILERIGLRFRKAVAEFAAGNDIAVIRFARGERKLEVMRPYLDRLAGQGRTGVAAIGVAQEFARVFTGTTYHGDAQGAGVPRFGYAKADRRVTAYYFYLVDEVFGPAFVKVCTYFPYPMKIWLNGHEYAKRAATTAGIAFTELDNGFATCDDPAGLQRLCQGLGPEAIQEFCQRWWDRLPLPLTEADRAGGYWWDIAMRQVEVSRTIVFDTPRQARGFFEALCADNLDIGRPEQMQLIFDRRVRTPPPGGYRTRLLRAGDQVSLNAYFRHSRVKSYLKCGRAFRIETVVNDTADLGVARRLEHLPKILSKARDVNRRMVDAFRVGQGCVLASPAFERVARPTICDGRRAPALRFGDPRVMALAGALCALIHVVAGFTNRSLRAQVATLLGIPYSMSQMSYDLRRLRMKGLITRLPHSNTYVLTPHGQRIAIFYTKLHNRLLQPLTAAHDPPAPLPLRQALRVIDRHITDYITEARMTA
jgi:predicted MarR family transcription regulator